MGNQGKDSIWQLEVLSTCSMNAQNLPLFFLKFTDQTENWGEDGIWELTVLATFFSFLNKTSELHKETLHVVVSSSFISDAFRF